MRSENIMIKRRFVAKDSRRAMAMIQNTLGSNAVIFSSKRVPEGIEIIAGLEEEPVLSSPLDEFIPTESVFDSVPADSEPLFNSVVNENGMQEAHVQKMQHEIQLLRGLLENQVIQSLNHRMGEGHPKQMLLKQQLIQQGFDSDLAHTLTSTIQEDLSILEAWEYVRAKFENMIPVETSEIIDQHKIIALIGATGVGKTTTLAKLATRFVLKYHPEDLGLITTDFNRVAAQGQLMLYGQILGVDTLTVHQEEDLRQALNKMQQKKLILIDTAGVSQRDNLNIARLFSIFNHSVGIIHAYLALSCTNQMPVLDETVHAFRSVNVSGCILTKADEATSLIPALSIAMKHQLNMAYITHGQRIPQDIRIADRLELSRLIVNASPFEEFFNARHKSIKPANFMAEENS